MSAWIVSKKHVDLMVAAITHGTRDGIVKPRRRNPNKLGQILVDECVRSVRYRYPNDDVEKGDLPGPIDPYYLKPYVFEHPRYLPTAAELYKAIDCYGYQSCEHPGWLESYSFRLCERIRNAIAARVPAAMVMREERAQPGRSIRDAWPEWEDAPWGFDVDEIAFCFARSIPEAQALLRAIQASPDDSTIQVAMCDWLQERGLVTGPIDFSSAFRMGLIAA